ncbi:MAG TPA: VOC family protein [Actinomycetota bacterium]|nr:VOC family protein [Actinomycetota bacterium]
MDDLAKAKAFYGPTLGVFEVAERSADLLSLRAANGYAVLIYRKPGHELAGHTILNFPVDDIEAAVDELRTAGVEFEQTTKAPSRRTKAHRHARTKAGLVQGSGRKYPVGDPGVMPWPRRTRLRRRKSTSSTTSTARCPPRTAAHRCS